MSIKLFMCQQKKTLNEILLLKNAGKKLPMVNFYNCPVWMLSIASDLCFRAKKKKERKCNPVWFSARLSAISAKVLDNVHFEILFCSPCLYRVVV